MTVNFLKKWRVRKQLRIYEVKVKGLPNDNAVNKLRRGVLLEDGFKTSPCEIKVLKPTKTNAWYEITLFEGHNLQIRKMFDSVGHSVVKLRRIAIGNIRDEKMPIGAYRVLTEKEAMEISKPLKQPSSKTEVKTKPEKVKLPTHSRLPRTKDRSVSPALKRISLDSKTDFPSYSKNTKLCRIKCMERLKSILVFLSTIGMVLMNWFAVRLYRRHHPGMISDKYPTFLTPADYSFMIWGWIYSGLVIFSIYQLLPKTLEKFAKTRSPYIVACFLNCLWLFIWQNGSIPFSVLVIFSLLAVLTFINLKLERENNFFARFVFGTYFGWISIAAIVNSAVLLRSFKFRLEDSIEIWLATLVIVIITLIGIFVRHKLPNVAYPLAIGWAITGIAVKQSGKTPIVFAAGIGLIALLISALSFVLKENPNTNE